MSPSTAKRPRALLHLAVGLLAAGLVSAARAVTITEADHEGRPQFKIFTARATYYLDRAGGGFSRLIDRDGADWIAFKKEPLGGSRAAAAAGYRGLPNLVFGRDNPDAGAGHPGHDVCESTVVASDAIRTVSKSRRWAWLWRFTEETATLTIEQADPARPYWFLYEGPVGGRWTPRTNYFGSDLGGPRRDTPTGQARLHAPWRWAYFGDTAAPRVLLLAQVSPDLPPGELWQMGATPAELDAPDGMVVFGFGRNEQGSHLRGAGRRFVLGFVEEKVEESGAHERVGQLAQRWMEGGATVRVSVTTLFGDMDCFRIETPTATFLYGKRGAGFASILDRDGRDWVSYRHGNLSAGEYRGLPKCGQPEKYFHCGYSFGRYRTDNVFESEVTLREPGHVRIRSVTRDGAAAGTWDFFPAHATFTLEKIPGDRYWFIYEGTPGGTLDEGDFVVRPHGQRTSLTRPWEDRAPWVAFGASESPHHFLLLNHQQDDALTSYVSWPYTPTPREPKPLMTVFGFGRPAWDDPAQHTPPLTRLPARYTIAFTAAGSDEALAQFAAELFR